MVPSGANCDQKHHLSIASISTDLGDLGMVATVTLQRMKTDSTGWGSVLTAGCACPRVPPNVCPAYLLHGIIALERWLALPQDPLFINSQGKTVTQAMVVSEIRYFVQACGFPTAEFAGHSLRRGGATSALLAGASIASIQEMGRWRLDTIWWYLQAPDWYLAQQVARMAPAAAP